jgi:hypothetical protein
MKDKTMNHAEYQVSIDKLVKGVGSKCGPKITRSTDAIDAAAQEYAIAKMVSDSAEDRAKVAREKLIAELTPVMPDMKGKHLVHDSAVTNVTVQLVANPSRIVEAKVLNMLVVKFGLSLTEASSLIENECKSESSGFQQRLSVLLKS